MAGVRLGPTTRTCSSTYRLNQGRGVTRLQHCTCHRSHPRPQANPRTAHPPRGQMHLSLVRTKPRDASVHVSSSSRFRLRLRVWKRRSKPNNKNKKKKKKKKRAESSDPTTSESGLSVSRPNPTRYRFDIDTYSLSLSIALVPRIDVFWGSNDGAMEMERYSLGWDTR